MPDDRAVATEQLPFPGRVEAQDGPPPADCNPVPGADLNPVNWARNVNIREIQSANGSG